MGVGAGFLEAYERVQMNAGLGEGASAVRDLASWKGFVAACAEGYDDVLHEYFHDLRVRDAIERGLVAESLMSVEGFGDFCRAVRAIDEIFREIATVPISLADPSAFSWWHHVVPGRGGEDFADDLRHHFGVTIHIIEG
ncbi:hypothetical protein [Streptomyces umbrinus]|uniref:hypothetical protein n=1 Tax=Streptomyces umbrinus TaxID=67370 RepID=UPI00340ED2C8